MSRPQIALVPLGLTVALTGYIVLGLGRVVLNGSDSLPHHGYFMVTWPKVVWRGAYVAFDPPRDVADRFGGLFFVKEVVGLPGDRFRNTAREICVRNACWETATREGVPYAPLLASGEVPDGALIVLGETRESLDSRYAVIGTIDRAKVLAVGFPIPIPHWKELQTWLEG